MTREEARSWIIDHWGNDLEDGTKQSEVVKICLSALSEPDYKKILDDIRKDLTNPNEFDGLPDSNYWQVAFLHFIDKHMRGKAE